MKLWYDTEDHKIITETELREIYARCWLPEMISEQGAAYVVENAQDFTFDAWINNCLTSYNGTLMPIDNSEEFKKVEEEWEGVHIRRENSGILEKMIWES